LPAAPAKYDTGASTGKNQGGALFARGHGYPEGVTRPNWFI